LFDLIEVGESWVLISANLKRTGNRFESARGNCRADQKKPNPPVSLDPWFIEIELKAKNDPVVEGTPWTPKETNAFECASVVGNKCRGDGRADEAQQAAVRNRAHRLKIVVAKPIEILVSAWRGLPIGQTTQNP
jgi:hypothetical protein